MVRLAFGYKFENDEIKVDEYSSKEVIKLYENYLKVKNMKQAIKDTAFENKTHSSVGRILMDERYLGTEHYPRLMTNELFNNVQEIRKENIAHQNRGKSKKKLYKYPTEFHFRIDKIEKKYADPIAQAEYAYGQIKEVEDGQ